MDLLRWLLLAVGAAAVVAYVVWWYRSREEQVTGRAWAAGLRAAALLLAWLLLLNPVIPVARRAGDASAAILLDASYSMSRPGGVDSASLWAAVVDSLGGSGGHVWLFGGDVPRYVSADSLPEEPLYRESRLAPALRAVAAAGFRQVVVASDGRIADAALSMEEARRLGLSTSFKFLGTPYTEIGISGVAAPSWVQVGDTVEVRVEIMASPTGLDSVAVDVIDERERVQASGWALVPEPGRFSPVRLAFQVQGRTGARRYNVRLALDSEELESRDDRRALFIRVTDRPVGPVLISLVPDWEPSFLVPNLDRLTDAPTVVFLWLADSLVSLDGYRSTSLAAVRSQARTAPLLVLHGYGADAPGWAQQLARDATRLLILPAGENIFRIPGSEIQVGPPADGEWYLSRETPRSPLALDLSGYGVEELSPLLRVREIEVGSAWTALELKRLRRGEPSPALVAGVAGTRRWAIASAEGYWRWAFRPGAGRQLYRALWTGVAGWLLADRSGGDLRLDPDRRVVERGEPLLWIVPPGVDSLSVEVMNRDSSALWRGVAPAGDSLGTVLPPEQYQYRARAYRADRVAASAEGPIEVEEFTRELLPGSSALLAELSGGDMTDREPGAVGHRRMATRGWPYLLLIALFCAEWAVRRFIGLR